jgi:hypothetical protein
MDRPTIGIFQATHSLVGGQMTWGDGEVIFHDGQTPPSAAAVSAEIVRLQAEYDAQEYARSRKVEYDALNQFELISDDDVNGTTTHKDAIAAIKTKYPKG